MVKDGQLAFISRSWLFLQEAVSLRARYSDSKLAKRHIHCPFHLLRSTSHTYCLHSDILVADTLVTMALISVKKLLVHIKFLLQIVRYCMVRNIIIGKISAQAKCSLEFAPWGNNPPYSLLIESPLQSVHVCNNEVHSIKKIYQSCVQD